MSEKREKGAATGGAAGGDRVVLLGIGQTRGKHADVLSIRGQIAAVRLDSGDAVLTLARDVHPIPRRPKPDF